MPVAAEVASTLRLPLDVLVVRKLGAPHNKELAIGAVAGGRVRVLDHSLIEELKIPMKVVEQIAAGAMEEAASRERYYRGERSAPDLHNWKAILVDDGFGNLLLNVSGGPVCGQLPTRTGDCRHPGRNEEAYLRIRNCVDRCICLAIPFDFSAVGQWYVDFDQVSDEDVRRIVEQSYLEFGSPVTTKRMTMS